MPLSRSEFEKLQGSIVRCSPNATFEEQVKTVVATGHYREPEAINLVLLTYRLYNIEVPEQYKDKFKPVPSSKSFDVV